MFQSFLKLEGYSIADLFYATPTDLHHIAASFTLFLGSHKKKNGLPLSDNTVDQYLSHVIYHLINFCIIDKTDDFRCPTTQRIIAGIKNRDRHLIGPLRLRISIAISLNIINSCITNAAAFYPCPVTIAFVTAALFLGYALSLRPDDYLVPIADNKHRLRASQFALWFPNISKPIFLSEPETYPPPGIKPLRISVLADCDKANQHGQLGMRACAANPNPNEPCFIHYLFEFFRKFPPQTQYSAIFSSIPPHINSSERFLYNCVRNTMERTAPTLGLQPSQLLPRGLRAGASAHIKASGGLESDCKASGGWKSKAYELYLRPDWIICERNAAAIHNAKIMDMNAIRYIHATQGNVSLPTT